MPATRQALETTDRYRAELLGVRDTAAAGVAAAWAGIDLDQQAATFAAWSRVAAGLIRTAQARTVTLADGYLAEYLTAETGETVPPQGLPAGDGQDDDDALGVLLLGALIMTRYMLGHRASRRAALESGAARAVRLARSTVMDTSRSALDTAMRASGRVSGWRRVASLRGGPCGACLALADGRVRPLRETLPKHLSCRCTREPVVTGVAERVFRPTGEQHYRSLSPAQQAALWRGRGGAAKRDALADGVPFDALVSRDGDGVTEAPLQALTPA